MSDTTRPRRSSARRATGIALAATLLTVGGTAAQSPTTITDPAATDSVNQATDMAGYGRHRDGSGFGDRGRQGFEPRGSGPGQGIGNRSDMSPRGSSITVTAIEGTDLSLATADGWSRTIDTTGVVLTRDGTAIAISDILVGERVRVVQTHNADGSYTVTGIEVRPAVASGNVGTVSADGLTVVGGDGTTTTVSVTAETTWSAAGATSASITDATAGRSVAVEGQLQADGSIVASRVRLG